MPLPLGTPPSHPVRIVIADDDRMFARMLRTRLGGRPDLDVVGIARNGGEAIALAGELEPDLILMDVNMPVMDGIEATRLIRELPHAPTVVMVTGEDEDADARAYEAGAAAYLRKSVELISLIDVVLAVAQLAATRA